jgi:hypothetical protein
MKTERKRSHLHLPAPLCSQAGSAKMSFGLVAVVVFVIAVFSLIDYVDKNSANSTAPDSATGFQATEEANFFDDEQFEPEQNIQNGYKLDVNEIKEEDLDPTQDPQFQETNARNAYYKPLSPEKKREKDKVIKDRAKQKAH